MFASSRLVGYKRKAAFRAGNLYWLSKQVEGYILKS
jgi:hypothetical protein